MSYIVSGLDPAPFRHLYGAGPAVLAAAAAVRVVADAQPGFPCRVTLEDAAPGESLLLLSYEHLPVDGPYRARHAIFVREGAAAPARFEDAIPEQLATRLISLRAFDRHGMMTEADVVEGKALDPLVRRYLARPSTAFLHAHNARRGCFAARIDRA